jgi:murein DD-endopeptidase MepM/ murein hydrolase activator NlpD
MIALCFVLNALAAAGSSVNDLRNQQSANQRQISEAQQALAEARREGNTLLIEIFALEVELEDITEQYFQASEELEQTSALLEKTRIELDEAKIRKDAQYEAFKDRVRFLHENGTAGYLEVLLKSRNLLDLIKNIEYINRIVEYDNNVALELEQTERLIAESVALIEQKEKEFILLEAQLRIKKAELEGLTEAKNAQLDRIRNTEATNERLVAYLRAEDTKLQNQIKAAEAAQAEAIRRAQQNASTANFSGRLEWPVPGRTNITSGFGSRTHPITRRIENHTGIDINGPVGTTIVAAEGGTVIMSGWNGGYGNCVVISHGNGLQTLYAHNSRNLVTVGQTVRKGEQIARMGSTGMSTGSHLHFEVRLNGVAVTPRNYLNY